MPDTNVNELKTENDIRNAVFSKMLIQELVAGIKKDGIYHCVTDPAYATVTVGVQDKQFTLHTNYQDPSEPDNDKEENIQHENFKTIVNKVFEFINYENRLPFSQDEVFLQVFQDDYDTKLAQFDREVQALAFKTLLAKEVETSLKAWMPFYCNANGTSRNVTISENEHGGYTLTLDSPALRHTGYQNGKTVELDSLQQAVDQACDFIGYADNPPFAQDVILHSVFEQDYSAAKQQIGLLTGQDVEAPQPHSGQPLIEQVESRDGVVYAKGKLANQQDVALTIELNGYQGAHVSIHALNEKGLAHADKLAIDVPQLQDMLEQALPRIGLCNPQGLSAAVSKMATVHEPLYAFRYDVAPAPTLCAKKALGCEQEIDFETHKPSADEQPFKNARAAVKGLETDLGLEFINDQFGAWINIQENNWTDTALGRVDTGEVSHGVAFIDGQLYEMSPSAYFYRDGNPCWSPVVQADNEEIAKVYQAITGKEFPVFKADGSEPEPFNRLIELKEEAGFVFDGSGFVKGTGVAESNAADPQQGAGEDAHIQVPAPAAQTKVSAGMRF